MRNYIGVLTSVNCSATVARHIAEAAERSGLLDGYPTTSTASCRSPTPAAAAWPASGEGFDILRRTLWGTAANPNFGAMLLVGLGCEVVQIDRLKADYGIADDADVPVLHHPGGRRHAARHRGRAGAPARTCCRW